MSIKVPIVSEWNSKGVDDAESRLDKFSDRAGKAFAAVGKAAALAGAAVGAFGVVAVKAAVEDAAAQEKLAKTLKNTTNATEDQIDAVEDYIGKTAIATGVADDKLRPAFETLTRSTKDTAKSQELLNLALDISAATGKDLETVSTALAKGYGGQETALKKLGVPLSDAALKSGDFSVAMAEINDTFGGTQAALADTAAGRFQRLQVVFGEIVETVGAALLPIVEKLAGFAIQTLIPAFEKVSKVIDEEGLGGLFKLLGQKIQEGLPIIGEKLKELAKAFVEWIGPQIPPMLEKLGELIGAAANWLIETGLPKLVEKLKLLGDKFVEWIGPNIEPMLQELAKFIGKLVEWILTKAVPKIIEATAKLSAALLKWLVDIGPDLLKGIVSFAGTLASEVVKAVVEALKQIGNKGLEIGKAFANAIIRFVNSNVIRKINELLEFTIDPPGPGSVTINPPDIPNIPELATGGIVKARRGGTLALLGEGGQDEAVIPLDRLGGTGGHTFVIQGALDPVSVAQQIRQILNDDATRFGRTAFV